METQVPSHHSSLVHFIHIFFMRRSRFWLSSEAPFIMCSLPLCRTFKGFSGLRCLSNCDGWLLPAAQCKLPNFHLNYLSLPSSLSYSCLLCSSLVCSHFFCFSIFYFFLLVQWFSTLSLRLLFNFISFNHVFLCFSLPALCLLHAHTKSSLQKPWGRIHKSNCANKHFFLQHRLCCCHDYLLHISRVSRDNLKVCVCIYAYTIFCVCGCRRIAK